MKKIIYQKTPILTCIHILLYFIASSLLEGHSYGTADKFGTYAKGLYSWEVDSVEKIIFWMWVIVVVLFVWSFLKKKKDSNPNIIEEADTSSKFLKFLTDKMPVLKVICLIGTIWTSCRCGLYS